MPFYSSQVVRRPGTEKQCPICALICRDGWLLRRHMNSAHALGDPHTCLICCKRIKRRDHLKKHLMDIHKCDKNTAGVLAKAGQSKDQNTA